ncbi:unnamed protein product [Effrenium voratum]|nr:unnamed protein product [Effrenium voratum]
MATVALEMRRRCSARRAGRLLALAAVACLGRAFAVWPLQRRGTPLMHGRGARTVSSASVVAEVVTERLDHVLPVGPACPFRSPAMVQGHFEQDMAMVMLNAQGKAGDFEALARQIQAGIQPDPRQQRKVGYDLKQQGELLKKLLDGMETSSDFQVMETFVVMETKAVKMGAPSARTVEKMTNWQGTAIVAEAEGMMVPPPPEGVDPVALARATPSGAQGFLSAPNAPRVLPFEEPGFPDTVEGQELKARYLKLVDEHSELVTFGEKYGGFDQAGKEFYLDRMEELTERWSSVISAASMMGMKPVRAYEAYSEEYLSQSGLSPETFRDLVNEVHQLLRRKAR